MPETSAQMHAAHQRKLAFDAAKALRMLDPAIRRAVVKHYRNADLAGTAAKIDKAIRDYHDRLDRIIRPPVAYTQDHRGDFRPETTPQGDDPQPTQQSY